MVTSRDDYYSACEGYQAIQAVRDIQAGRDIRDMQNIRCASDTCNAWREHLLNSAESPPTMNCPHLPLEIWEIILRLTEDPVTIYYCRFLCWDFNLLSNEIFGCGFNRPPRCIRDPTLVPCDSQIMITHSYLESMVATCLDVDIRMISDLLADGLCPRNCDLIDGLVIKGRHLRHLKSVTATVSGSGEIIPMNFEHEQIDPRQTYLLNLFGNHPMPIASLYFSEIRFTSDPPIPLKYSARHLLATERDALMRGSDPNWSNPIGCSPLSNYFQVGPDIWSCQRGRGMLLAKDPHWSAQTMEFFSPEFARICRCICI